ncbi:MAG: tRNA (guanosine(37)-N1)-methyltransferase TrmD [Coxiella endosymbiont of Haemaphysalis qinghaiensis]
MLTFSTQLIIGVITLFPKMFEALKYGVIGRALKNNLLILHFWNPRDYTTDIHHTVDDRPYGGGPGMVMKFEPLSATIKAAKKKLGENTAVVYLSPQGQLLTHEVMKKKTQDSKSIILLAGRYEGIDERLIEAEVDEEWSIGDYIVSGGELPAMLLIDALTRFLPGVLGHEDSASQDSFTSGLLDYPQYTRPEKIANWSVPKVLLSGNHGAIARWRLKQALGRAWQRRQDLIKRRTLSENERRLLDEFIEESL